MSTTTNYHWTLPTIGGDTGSWGSELNGTLQAIDTAVKAASDLAAAAVPILGGPITGPINVSTSTLALTAKGGISGSQSLNAAVAQAFTFTVTGDLSLSIVGTPSNANTAFGVILWITNGNSHGISWPSGTRWPSGSVPALSVSGLDVVVLLTKDQGATWGGVVVAKGLA